MNQGLEQVARLLNLYEAAGLKARDVKVTAIFHGAADWNYGTYVITHPLPIEVFVDGPTGTSG